MLHATAILRLSPLLLAACAASASSEAGVRPAVEHWGTMREVLREGRTEGRVALEDAIGPHSFGVGALEGLAAEITVIAGKVHLAEVLDPDSGEGLRVRGPRAGERATLLVLADVAEWTERTLPAVRDLAQLEAAVARLAASSGIDTTAPFPFRVEGTARELRLHVLNHSCPIADPNGPSPWRFSGTNEAAILVGFHATGAAGQLTHHGSESHVHALLPGREISGHLDAVRLEPGARLLLPAP